MLWNKLFKKLNDLRNLRKTLEVWLKILIKIFRATDPLHYAIYYTEFKKNLIFQLKGQEYISRCVSSKIYTLGVCVCVRMCICVC